MLSTLPPFTTTAREYLDELTRDVDVALFSGCPERISRALRSVQSARALTVQRFHASRSASQKRSCLDVSRALQSLADRCIAARRASS